MASPNSVAHLDGITLILNDHRNVDAFFSMYERASDAEEKLRLVAKMIEELTIHASIEERVLYPLIDERLDDGAELKEHAIEEHNEAREVLAELEGMPVTDESFDEKVNELISEVRHHVDEEERDLLPRLGDALSTGELTSLAEQLQNAKADAPVSPSQVNGASGSDVSSAHDGDRGGATGKELYERARELDIEGRSKMSKDELAREVDQRS